MRILCYAPVIAERAKEAGEEERTASCFLGGRN